MTIAWSPTGVNAAYDPRAKPALTGTPLTVTARSVRGMPTRNTPPACTWPGLPSACSTNFQSGSVANETPGVATATSAHNVSARFSVWVFMMIAPCSPRVLLMQPRYVVPIDVLHERVDVLGGGGAV